MIYGLWQSAGGMAAQDYRQSVLSNNLANADTPGFKADRISFQERLGAARAAGSPPGGNSILDALSGGVFETSVYTDFSQGGLDKTEGKLDTALDGEGFFSVQGRTGTSYTRDGRMIMDKTGTLIHAASGRPMLSAEGRPIVLNPSDKTEITIDAAGRIRQGGEVSGTLGIVAFDDPRKLTKAGENLYAADGARSRESHAEVRQGYYETSGVKAVDALVEMIAASRAYQMNATMISMQDQSLGRAVNDVGKVG
jgi:flagellar basal-body rod protein FlgF